MNINKYSTRSQTIEHIAKKQKISTDSFNSTLIAKDEINAAIFAKVEMLSADNALLENYGNKHGNNVRMKRLIAGLNIPGIEVPALHGISTDQMEKFLQLHQLSIAEEWKSLRDLYENLESAQDILASIRKKIAGAFDIASQSDENFSRLVSMEFISWLNNSQGHYLMVRSSGEEDSCHTANAGGNISRAYVSPTRAAFCSAAKDVVCSYFESPSLRNLIAADVNPFEQGPKFAVTAQILIGECPFTKKDPIPVSLVLFTTEPLYVGGESFRTMRISATYGHGEGVVGGVGIATDTILLLVSESRPDHLYVLYDNSDKPVRLAPVSTQEGIKLQPVENPDHLMKKPVLNSELLSRLFTWGVIAEHFFGGNATDLEIVIKGDTIYPVQARPVNRLGLIPTYLNVKGLPENPVEKTIRGEIVVPGRASVVEIASPKELCFAATLEDAEKKIYDKKVHKAVIVTHPEPANSHPVVNFSGLGVPCLYVKSQEDVSRLIQKISKKHPLLLCMQEGTVNLWDSSKGDPKSCIFSGYAVHPAKIPISLRSKTGEIPEDVKELLLRLRSAETHEAALAVLAKLREHPFVEEISKNREALAEQIQSRKIVPKQVHETHAVLDHLIQKVGIAFEETEAALKKSSDRERLRPLFHVKVLNTLLSMLSVDPIVKDAKALINYQEKFNHPVHFAGIYLAGDAAFEESSRAAWRNFLESLETQVTLNQIEKLHSVIRTLESSGMLSTWFAFYFKDNTSLETVLQTFNPTDQQKLGQAARLRMEIKKCMDNVGSFDVPSGNICTLMNHASPVTCMVILNTLQEIVDLYDTAIKGMKASADWSSIEKVSLFKSMLKPYFKLLQSTVDELKPNIPMHDSYPIDRYMIIMNSIFLNLEGSPGTEEQLAPSRGFSVAAAAMGSGATFSRHYPDTLEDFFTLIHQNLLVIVSHCKSNYVSDGLIEKSALPQNFISALMSRKKFARRPAKRMGIDISEREIRVLFNIPLNNHSAQMGLKYDKANGKMTVQGYLLGRARARWGEMAFMADILNEVNILPLNSPIQISTSDVKFEWIARDEQTLQLIVTEFDYFCRQSFSLRDVDLASLLTHHTIDIHLLIELTLKKFPDDAAEKLLKWMLREHVVSVEKAMVPFIEKAIEENNKVRCEHAIELLHHTLSYPEWIPHSLIALSEYALRIRDYWLLHKAFNGLENVLREGFGSPNLMEKIISWTKKYVIDEDSDLGGSIKLLELLLESGSPLTEEITNLLDILSIKPQFQKEFLSLVIVLIQKKHPIKKEIEASLISLIMNDQEDLEKLVTSLKFDQLPVPAELAKSLISLAEVGCRSINDSVRVLSIHIFKSLFKANLGFAQAIAVTEDLNISDAFDLYEHLVKHNQGIAQIDEVSGNGILNPDTTLQERSLKLFKKRFEQGQGFEQAIMTAEKGVKSVDLAIKQSAVALFMELNKYGKGITESLSAVPKLDSLGNKILKNVHLTSILMGKKCNLDQTEKEQLLHMMTSTALVVLTSSAGEKVRHPALTLFRELFNHNKVEKNQQFYAHMFVAAEKGVNDPSYLFRAIGLKFFTDLIKVGYGKNKEYKVMVSAAAKLVDNPSFDLRRKSHTLFRELFKKGYGIKEATAKANKAMQIQNQSIRKTAKKLLDGVYKLGNDA